MPPQANPVHDAERLSQGSVLSNATPHRDISSLPDETIAKILSHIPRIPATCYTLDQEEMIDWSSLLSERHFTINSIAQTNKSLRSVCLPHLWEFIEVFDGMKLPNGLNLPNGNDRNTGELDNDELGRYAQELLRQLRIVTDPKRSLAQHVKYINTILVPNSITTVYEELLRSISRLPNVHTIRLVSFEAPLDKMSRLHERYQFPQIRHAYLNGTSLFFMATCPRLITLSCPSEEKQGGFTSTNRWFAQWIPWNIASGVETLGTFDFNDDLWRSPSVLKQFVNLRDITIDPKFMRFIVYLNCDLGDFYKRLHTIRIRADQNPFPGPIMPSREEEDLWVVRCRAMLLNIQRRDNQVKHLYMTRFGGVVEHHILSLEV